MNDAAVYVYCLVSARQRPRLARTLEGLPHAGAVRVLQADGGLWAIVSDVPLDHYGENALRSGLADLDWVSHAAVAHERVVESFLTADAVLPMKLFTMFASDARVLKHIAGSRGQFDALIARVSRRDEWGIRVSVSKAARRTPSHSGASPATRSGAQYLRRKKAQHDERAGRAERAHSVAADLFESLARHATEARKRPATELGAGGGPLVLDAAFLVPRSRTAKLRAAAARHARTLSAEGYDLALTGPWPPYSFMQD
jgi:hypothetical protein